MRILKARMTTDVEAAVDAVIERVGSKIVLGLPLGLGKPLRFANALYHRARNDPALSLHIVTGLSLQVPTGSSSLERRFLGPFTQRLYGDIPDLAYARDAAAGKLPGNVTVSEFFFQAGNFLNQEQQQRHYVCSNYTHAVRDLMAQGINVLAQMVAPDLHSETGAPETLSLSCNPDLTLDLVPLLREREKQGSPVAILAETNRALPYMGNDAALAAETFDVILDHPDSEYPLFSVPQTAISPQDHLIGFYASTLLRDGGTLQVGIGSLGTALVYSTILRHQQNAKWRRVHDDLEIGERFPVAAACGGTGPFSAGLYGCSEMMMEGFIDLMEAGVLTRSVDENIVMHGGFFLGSQAFYERLRNMPVDQRGRICMTSVNFINDLFDHRFGKQSLKVAQRVHGRFINSAMMQTLNGMTVSDGLDDGRVISGVGGQYNFVAMAHELPDARSIITLRSTREQHGKLHSNIVFNYPHCTIPRHLRDIVVTEYGIADLRGQVDEEVYVRLISVADSQFQQELLTQAQEAGKVAADWVIPAQWRNNTAEAISRFSDNRDNKDLFPVFPFGHDFTDEELLLAKALKLLKAKTGTPAGKAVTLLGALGTAGRASHHRQLLARMELDAPGSLGERLEQWLMVYALEKTAPTQ